jgi:sugar phosphate isomerase/epimerase
MLRDYIGHLHLIDSDGTLHDKQTSTHTPFGEGFIDFKTSLMPIRSVIMDMEWWTADFCFCAETEIAAKQAPVFMKSLAEEMI